MEDRDDNTSRAAVARMNRCITAVNAEISANLAKCSSGCAPACRYLANL